MGDIALGSGISSRTRDSAVERHRGNGGRSLATEVNALDHIVGRNVRVGHQPAVTSRTAPHGAVPQDLCGCGLDSPLLSDIKLISDENSKMFGQETVSVTCLVDGGNEEP